MLVWKVFLGGLVGMTGGMQEWIEMKEGEWNELKWKRGMEWIEMKEGEWNELKWKRGNGMNEDKRGGMEWIEIKEGEWNEYK